MNFIFAIMAYYPDHAGGAWMYANGLAEELVKQGHKVDVIVPRQDDKLTDNSTLNGVTIHRLPAHNKINPNFFEKWSRDNKELVRFIKDQPFDKDSVFINHQAYMGKGFLKWKGPRTAAIFHGPWDEEFLPAKSLKTQPTLKKVILRGAAKWMRGVEKKSLYHAKTIFTASNYAANKFLQTHPRIDHPIVNISAGTDYERFKKVEIHQTNNFKEKFKIDSDHFLIGSVRRLDKRMGLDMLIDGFNIACKSFTNLRLIIAGKGPQFSELKEKIDKLNLSNKATLAGFISDEDLATFYSSCDLTVMPSIDLEGFGLSTIESLGCGTPVIASNSGANLETVSPLDENLIFEKGNAQDIAKKIIQFVSGEKPMPSEESCRQYALHSFSWKKSAQKLVSHFLS